MRPTTSAGTRETTPRTVTVYVPKPGTTTAQLIDAGSGIVASPTDATSHPATGSRPMLMADFEGNRFGAVNMVRYADRVLHAHDRARTRYPTIARSLVPADDLVAVGALDTVEGRIDVTDPDALARWLDVPVEDLTTTHASELECTGTRYSARREILAARASGDPAKRAAADLMQRRLNIAI